MELTTKRRVTRMTKEEQELAQYFPSLKEELRQCMEDISHNEMLFDLEVEPDLIEQRIYEREALRCRYRYLMRRARANDLRVIL